MVTPSGLPVATRVYVQDAGVHAISLGAAGLCLLQLWTGCPTTHWELADPSAASALSFGPVGVVAVLGADCPLGPLAHHAVLGQDAGLEGDRGGLLRAHAGAHEKFVSHLHPQVTHKPRNISVLPT